jgi:hypothetical protein
MIYRHQVLRTLRHDALAEFLQLQRDKNTLLADAGLATYSVWAPAFGGLHHLYSSQNSPRWPTSRPIRSPRRRWTGTARRMRHS